MRSAVGFLTLLSLELSTRSYKYVPFLYTEFAYLYDLRPCSRSTGGCQVCRGLSASTSCAAQVH